MQLKVFAFADWYLPGHKGGGAVTALANLVELLGDEFEFYVFTRDRDQNDKNPYSEVPREAWVRVGRARVMYTRDLSFGNLRRRIHEVAPDVLYLGSFFSRMTVKTLLMRQWGLLPESAAVLAPRGEFGAGALTLKKFRKRVYVSVATRAGLFRGLHWHASSEVEKEQILRRIYFNGRRNGAEVRVARTIPSANLLRSAVGGAKPAKRPGKARFVFLSRIARNKNLRFALELLGSIGGEVEFAIYGPAEDEAYWDDCSWKIRAMPRDVRVSYMGPLAYEDVERTLAQYDFLMFPTLGENFGYVIVEAMAAGCPVLISDQSPWRNLQAEGVGWDMPLSEPEKWQAALRECVEMDGERYREMSERARNFVHEWARSIAFREDHVELFQHALRAEGRKTSPVIEMG